MTNEPTRGEAVAEGMAAARRRGVRLGRPPAPPPAGAARAAELRNGPHSLAAIAATLNKEKVPTPSGQGEWTRSSVQYALAKLDAEREGAKSSRTAEPPAYPGA